MAAPAPDLPEELLHAFVARLRRRHAAMAAARSALGAFLPWGVLGAASLWVEPGAALALAGLGSVFALTAAWLAARRPLPNHLLLAGVEGAPEVHDALGTWLDDRGANRPGPLVSAWLADDLWRHARTMPDRAWSRIGRRPLGAVRWLLPLLVLLLWGRLLVDGIQLPLPGAGGGATAGGGSTGPRARPGPGPSELPEPPPPAPELPPQDEPEPPPPSQPDPLLELPQQEQFVVPQFMGDGPSRKALAERAEVELGGGGSVAPQPVPAGAGASQADRERSHEYERAAERAERARNVPVEERPMVRRFFELLRKEGT